VDANGVDFAQPFGGDVADALRRAFVAHPVLVLRNQGMTPPALLALAKVLGEPQRQLLEDYRLSDIPTISIVASNLTDRRGDGRRVVFGGAWHTDDSYFAVPAKATMLYASVIPPKGGDTLFADTTRAYEALDAVTRAKIDGRRATHTYQSRRNLNFVPTRSTTEEIETPSVDHPIVRTDEASGRRSLYLNPNRMESVVGLDDDAGDRLLDALIAHATEERFVYRHVWQPHDVVVWDNGRSMHRATDDYGDDRREMLRILLRGTVPV
jgi:taurine dioxygenase